MVPSYKKTASSDGAFGLSDELHGEVSLARELFAGGHYDESVRKAAQRFMNRVQQVTGRHDLDGVALINKAFSADSPLLEFSSRGLRWERDEHDGYRFLAVGLTQAIRNVLTHHDNYGLDARSAREWLMFISAMHRRLDQAVRVARHPDE